MVFFTCDGCGESVKKPQVEKHRGRCRQSGRFSCIDCNKTFVGDEFKSHTKCVSEDQRYGGKNYVQKENKGEAKQERWVEQVQRAIAAASPTNKRLGELLQKLLDYPNIPRKQAKFENFLSNSLRVYDKSLAHATWEAIAAAAQPPAAPAANGTEETGKRKLDDEPGEQELDNKRQKVEEAVTFKWKSTIKQILKEAPDKQLKLKKLRKKVLAIYKNANSDAAVDDFGSKLESKLNGMNRVKLDGNVVMLLDD